MSRKQKVGGAGVGELFVADGTAVGAAGGSGETKTSVDPVENDGIGFHFPSLFLEGFFHRVFIIPKKDLGGINEADDFIGLFGAIKEQGNIGPGGGGRAGLFCFFRGGGGAGGGLGRGLWEDDEEGEKK